MKTSLFWKKIAIRQPSDCWEWQGSADKDGYGLYHVDSYRGIKKKQRLRAHRVAWTSTRGPIPDDKIVCHHCDNRLCCNPDHMYLGTDLDNYDDAQSRARNPRGARKLTPEQVQLIRTSPESLRSLAGQFAVRPNVIDQIRRRKTYKWVP